MNPIFVKLMMMTTSPNDAEALTALRKANAMLASANVNWAEYLSKGATAPKEDQTYRTPPSQRQRRANEGNPFTAAAGGGTSSSEKFDDEKEINKLFEQAFRNATGGFAAFLESVHEWWEEKGFLTSKQYYAVKRAAGE